MTVDWHPTEDDLILHYYRDTPANALVRVDTHLLTCEECRTAWQALTATLALADTGDVPDPGDDFTERIWAAIAPKLTPRARTPRRSVTIVMALAASLLLTVAAGTLWVNAGPGGSRTTAAERPVTPPEGGATRATDARERVLLTALSDHLSQTEMLLVELLNAPDVAPASLTFEQASADDLVASGRLYRDTAEETGDAQVVNVIDDLESVLVEVARRSSRMQPADLVSLRARIQDNALLFKVRAVTTDIHDRQQTWRQ